MVSLLALALDSAAEQKGGLDADWLCHVATHMRNEHASIRVLESRAYLGEGRDTNGEGVSLAEWRDAAGIAWDDCDMAQRIAYVQYWSAGEDPTEYRS